MSSKTEEPTAERLRRAAREGDVPVSPVLVRTLALFAAVAVVPSAARALEARFAARLHGALDGTAAPNLDETLREIVTLVAPLASVAAAVAIAVGLLQTKGALGFGDGRRARHDSRAGFGLVDTRRAGRAALAATVVVGLATACLHTLRIGAPSLADAVGSTPRTLRVMAPLLEKFAWSAAAVLLVASVLDVALDRAAWLSRLRMTPREIREERREREGDPELRRARRRAHEALVRGANQSER